MTSAPNQEIHERDCLLILARLLPKTKQSPSRAKVIESVANCLSSALPRGTPATRAESALELCLTRGWLTQKPLQLTDEGRQALQEKLGLNALPNAKNWNDVRRRVLVPAALGQGDVSGRAHSPDQLAANVLAAQHGLALGGSLRQVVDRLAWRTLGVETDRPFDAVQVQRHVLRTIVPSDVRVSPRTWRRMLAMKAVGASRSDTETLHRTLVSRWADEKEPRPAQQLPSAVESHNDNVPQDKAGPKEPDRLETFAAAVVDAMRLPGVATFHGDRAFIGSVWEHMKGHPCVQNMSLAQFKERLVQAHRAGLLLITRADLVTAMDPKEVQRSKTEYLGATFHFVAVEAGGAR